MTLMLILCFRNAHDQNVLLRRAQSNAPHVLAWLGIGLEKTVRVTQRLGTTEINWVSHCCVIKDGWAI